MDFNLYLETSKGKTMVVSRESWVVKNLGMVVGFLVNIILLSIAIGKQIQIVENQTKWNAAIEQRLTADENSLNQHMIDKNVHTDREWRDNTTATMNRIEGKMDAHIMIDASRLRSTTK